MGFISCTVLACGEREMGDGGEVMPSNRSLFGGAQSGYLESLLDHPE